MPNSTVRYRCVSSPSTRSHTRSSGAACSQTGSCPPSGVRPKRTVARRIAAASCDGTHVHWITPTVWIALLKLTSAENSAGAAASGAIPNVPSPPLWWGQLCLEQLCSERTWSEQHSAPKLAVSPTKDRIERDMPFDVRAVLT